MNIKTENWLGNEIRFVEVDGEWWAVAKDITRALELSNTTVALKSIDKENIRKVDPKLYLGSVSNVKVNIINELGIYTLVMRSNKPEAKEFQKFIYNVIKQLRKQSGLQGFEVFRMLDKEHQKQQMEILRNAYDEPHKANYIKANTLANKAVSSYYGFPKMIKKEEMTPEMLVTREKILEDAVKLLEMQEEFGLEHVSQMLYKKWQPIDK